MCLVYIARGFAPLSSRRCDLGGVVPVPRTWAAALADVRHLGFHVSTGCVHEAPDAVLHWSHAHVGFGRCLHRH